MDKFLVHQTQNNNPSTHAIVIGIGAYPYLPGGSSRETTELDGGMKQLTSPPVSAREFAAWLIESFHNPDKPLATVSLLLSEDNKSKFTNTKTNQEFDVEYPTIDAVTEALVAWKDLGDLDAENQLIFFFCGHGIARGTDTALLLADYGKTANNVFKDAIDFKSFQEEMNKCIARHKVYFVDACRVGSQSIIENLGYVGDPIFVDPRRPITGTSAPIFYSTLAGEKAYGRKIAPSYYTETLLKALNGEAAHDQNEDWRVSTNRISEAIGLYMNRAAKEGWQRAQVAPTDGLVNFDIHFLKDVPKTNAFVECSPSQAQQEAELSYSSTTNPNKTSKRQKADKHPWIVPLEVGEYKFIAEFSNQNFNNKERTKYLLPPFPKVELKVAP